MERTEIIKALECCKANSGAACSGCPYMYAELADDESCSERMALDTLSLIKELTEKVEAYRNELGEVRVALAEANNDNRKLTEENERLRANGN